MRKLLATAGLVVFVTVAFVSTASAGLEGPWGYSGRVNSHCENPTHLSFYDPRNAGPTIWNQGAAGGDSVYYVDTDPTAGFKAEPTLGYTTAQTAQEDCKGTPVLRATKYAAVRMWGHQVGWPSCPRSNDRNPRCSDTRNGAWVGFYVSTPDRSEDFGRVVGYTVP